MASTLREDVQQTLISRCTNIEYRYERFRKNKLDALLTDIAICTSPQLLASQSCVLLPAGYGMYNTLQKTVF